MRIGGVADIVAIALSRIINDIISVKRLMKYRYKESILYFLIY